MSVNQVRFVNRWINEVWNDGSPEAVVELSTEDTKYHGLVHAAQPLQGIAAYQRFVSVVRGAFPDLQVKLEDLVVEGDRAAARWAVRMTHTGAALGVPATGRNVLVRGMWFLRISNGKLRESWHLWDALGLLQQIGVAAPLGFPFNDTANATGGGVS